MFVVGVLPALLVACVFKRMKEPEVWQKARDSAQKGNRTNWFHGDLFKPISMRKHTIIGLILAISIVGLWALASTPELIREARAMPSVETKNWYVRLGTMLQDVEPSSAFLPLRW